MTDAIKNTILQLIRERNHVSFAELARMIDGFSAPDRTEGLSITSPRNPNVILWAGITKDAADALEQLIASETIHFRPAHILVYLVDGMALQLPLVKGNHQYKKPHWLPVTMSIGPPRKVRRN
jgi:hypothetical protein